MEYVELPSKLSRAKALGFSEGDVGWMWWVLPLPNGLVVPEDILMEIGAMREKNNKKYALAPLLGKLRLTIVYNGGSKRSPRYQLVALFDGYGNLVADYRNLPGKDQEAKYNELAEATKKFFELYKKTKEAPVFTPLSPDNVDVKVVSDKIEIPLRESVIAIYVKEEGSFYIGRKYKVIKLSDPYNILSTVIENHKDEFLSMIQKHGFNVGKYGGYISHSNVDTQSLLKDLEVFVRNRLGEIVDIYNKTWRGKTEAVAEAKKEALATLGVLKPIEAPVTGEEMLKWLLEKVGVKPTAPTTPTAVVQQEQAKQRPEQPAQQPRIEKSGEKLEKISRDDIVKALVNMGFVPVKLVVFDLPTEYKGVVSEYGKDESTGRLFERKLFSVNPAKFRTLRKRFYDILNKVAYRTPAGWVLHSSADKSLLDELDKVIKEFESLSGGKPTVWIYESFLPREPVVKWVTDYIAEKKAEIEELKQKLATSQLKKAEIARYRQKLDELTRFVSQLEQELKNIS